MTEILVTKNQVTVTGHTPDPVVCHSVSALLQTAGIYLEARELGSMVIDEDAPSLVLSWREDPRSATIAELLFTGLHSIDESYPGNLNIRGLTPGEGGYL